MTTTSPETEGLKLISRISKPEDLLLRTIRALIIVGKLSPDAISLIHYNLLADYGSSTGQWMIARGIFCDPPPAERLSAPPTDSDFEDMSAWGQTVDLGPARKIVATPIRKKPKAGKK